MLRVGIAEFGFMGRMHYRCWKGINETGVAAICDANPNIVEDTKRAVGNIEGAEGAIDLGGVELYADFDRMLESAKLDAVSITLPIYLHAEYSIKVLAVRQYVVAETTERNYGTDKMKQTQIILRLPLPSRQYADANKSIIA